MEVRGEESGRFSVQPANRHRAVPGSLAGASTQRLGVERERRKQGGEQVAKPSYLAKGGKPGFSGWKFNARGRAERWPR